MAAGGATHGIARYIIRLLEHMPELAPDIELDLLVPKADMIEAARRFPNYRLIPTLTRPFEILEQFELPYLAWRHKPDLIHFPSIAVAHCLGIPTLVTVPDLIPFLFEPKLSRRLYARLVLGPVARRADRVLAISERTKDDIIEKLAVENSKIQVSYIGVDPPSRALDPGVMARHNLERPYLLCVSNPKPHKNLAFLLRAFAKLSLPLQLVLVSPASEELDHLVRCDPRVLRVHPLPEEDLQSLYAQAWAAITPSLYEGFGLPPAEAMGYGTPVLVANAGSLPEVVGEAGLLFDPTDEASLISQLTLLYHDQELRNQLKEAGPKRVLRFQWRESTKDHIDLYRAILG